MRQQILTAAVFATAGMVACVAQVNVLTFHNDVARTGQNTNEVVLTPANVNTATFGKLFSHTVDGQVYAQPLYVSDLAIPGQGTHNVVFVVTQHKGVYAFDADSAAGSSGGLLWNVSLGNAVATPNGDFGNRYGAYHDIDPEVGVTSTPVIDPASGTMYIDAFGRNGTSYQHLVHALDITTGAERSFSPVVVAASVPGNGLDSSGGVVTFNPEQSLQRPALLLNGGKLFIAYSGYADTDPYHGWVLGFDPATLTRLPGHVFNTTPNSTYASVSGLGIPPGEGGIWMSGNGPAADAAGNIFFMVGNGPFNANTAGGTEYGDSFMRLSTTNGLAPADYFTPYNQLSLAQADADVGSGGLLLLPDGVGSAAHPQLLVGCGKEGKIYLLDRANLGKYRAAGDTQIVQELPGAVGGCWSSPAYFNGKVYYVGSGDSLKAFQLYGGKFNPTTPVSHSAATFSAGGTPSVSANGTTNGIVWFVQTDGYPGGQAVLHAFDASNVARELYNSAQNASRDNPGPTVKFNTPTVANGKVYVGVAGQLAVYGLASFVAAPVIQPDGGIFTNSVSVSLSSSTSTGTIYYTIDGSAPTTNSARYAHPFSITNTTSVNAFVFVPGAVPSPVVSATFLNSADYVAAPGFLKQEFYSNAARQDLESSGFSTPADYVHFLASAETPSGQGVNYAERVSGFFLPPVTGNYVFYVCSDDDSDLFLSTDDTPAELKLIAQETSWSNSREWVSSAGGSQVSAKRSDQFTGTQWPAGNTITLQAGKYYYLEAVHHQGAGGDNFAATYKLVADPDPADGDAPRLTGPSIATYAQSGAVFTLTGQPAGTLAVAGSPATFTAAASAAYPWDPTPLPLFYQWQTAPPGGGFTNIPGAIGPSYTTAPLALADNGRLYRAVIATPGASTNSAVAQVSVVADAVPPLPIAAVGIGADQRTVTVQFSKPLNPASAGTAAAYSFDPGSIPAVTAAVDATGTNVSVTAGTALPVNTVITLAINGVADLEGNKTPKGSFVSFSFKPITYAQNILLDGPAAYFRFEEPAGAAAATNWAGGANGAYFTGDEATPGAGGAPSSASGDAGPRPPAYAGFETNNHAATFDGATRWVDARRQYLQDAKAFTLEYWVSPAGRAGFPGRTGLVGQNDAVEYGFIDANDIQIWTPNGGSLTTGYGFADGEWHHVATIGDGASISTYYDGVLQGSATQTTADYGASGYNVHIGGGGVFDATGNYFHGHLDEVAIFTNAVPATRVAAHYRAGKLGGDLVTPVGSGPAGLFEFTGINEAYGRVLLQWVGGGVLEEADGLNGPWTASAAQGSPALLPVEGHKFYRLRK
jgi:Concanavalin A-like lectin/glucanases superfamily/Chitobiase/beta-hexosaminidase C-terminal domain/PA14 domain/Bacterial Ig-like domain